MRIVAAFLALTLILPGPALALRVQAGTESDSKPELISAFTAGAEQDPPISRRKWLRTVGTLLGMGLGGIMGYLIGEPIARRYERGPLGAPDISHLAEDISPAEVYLGVWPSTLSPGARETLVRTEGRVRPPSLFAPGGARREIDWYDVEMGDFRASTPTPDRVRRILQSPGRSSIRFRNPEGTFEVVVVRFRPRPGSEETVLRLLLNMPERLANQPLDARIYDGFLVAAESPSRDLQADFRLIRGQGRSGPEGRLATDRILSPQRKTQWFASLPADLDWAAWERSGPLAELELVLRHPRGAGEQEVEIWSPIATRSRWYQRRQDNRGAALAARRGGSLIGAALLGTLGYQAAKLVEPSGSPVDQPLPAYSWRSVFKESKSRLESYMREAIVEKILLRVGDKKMELHVPALIKQFTYPEKDPQEVFSDIFVEIGSQLAQMGWKKDQKLLHELYEDKVLKISIAPQKSATPTAAGAEEMEFHMPLGQEFFIQIAEGMKLRLRSDWKGGEFVNAWGPDAGPSLFVSGPALIERRLFLEGILRDKGSSGLRKPFQDELDALDRRSGLQGEGAQVQLMRSGQDVFLLPTEDGRALIQDPGDLTLQKIQAKTAVILSAQPVRSPAYPLRFRLRLTDPAQVLLLNGKRLPARTGWELLPGDTLSLVSTKQAAGVSFAAPQSGPDWNGVDELLEHLKPLTRKGQIEEFLDREVRRAGTRWVLMEILFLHSRAERWQSLLPMQRMEITRWGVGRARSKREDLPLREEIYLFFRTVATIGSLENAFTRSWAVSGMQFLAGPEQKREVLDVIEALWSESNEFTATAAGVRDLFQRDLIRSAGYLHTREADAWIQSVRNPPAAGAEELADGGAALLEEILRPVPDREAFGRLRAAVKALRDSNIAEPGGRGALLESLLGMEMMPTPGQRWPAVVKWINLLNEYVFIPQGRLVLLDVRYDLPDEDIRVESHSYALSDPRDVEWWQMGQVRLPLAYVEESPYFEDGTSAYATPTGAAVILSGIKADLKLSKNAPSDLTAGLRLERARQEELRHLQMLQSITPRLIDLASSGRQLGPEGMVASAGFRQDQLWAKDRLIEFPSAPGEAIHLYNLFSLATEFAGALERFRSPVDPSVVPEMLDFYRAFRLRAGPPVDLRRLSPRIPAPVRGFAELLAVEEMLFAARGSRGPLKDGEMGLLDDKPPDEVSALAEKIWARIFQEEEVPLENSLRQIVPPGPEEARALTNRFARRLTSSAGAEEKYHVQKDPARTKSSHWRGKTSSQSLIYEGKPSEVFVIVTLKEAGWSEDRSVQRPEYALVRLGEGGKISVIRKLAEVPDELILRSGDWPPEKSREHLATARVNISQTASGDLRIAWRNVPGYMPSGTVKVFRTEPVAPAAGAEEKQGDAAGSRYGQALQVLKEEAEKPEVVEAVRKWLADRGNPPFIESQDVFLYAQKNKLDVDAILHAIEGQGYKSSFEKNKLGWRKQEPAAGAEEGPVTRAVRKEILYDWWGWGIHSLSDFRHVKFTFDGEPETAFVRGPEKEWWIHFHAELPTSLTAPRGLQPGFLVKVKSRAGRFVRRGEILIEPGNSQNRNRTIGLRVFVPLDGRTTETLAIKRALEKRVRGFLHRAVKQPNLKRNLSQILEHGMVLGVVDSAPLLLVQGKGNEKELYQIVEAGELDGNGETTQRFSPDISGAGELEVRFGLPNPAAGVEEGGRLIDRAHPLIREVLGEVETLFLSQPEKARDLLGRVDAEFPNITAVEKFLMDWREKHYQLASFQEQVRDPHQKGWINPKKADAHSLTFANFLIHDLEKLKSRLDQLEGPPVPPKDRIELLFDIASAHILRGAARIYNWSGRLQDFLFAEEYLQEAETLSQRTHDYFKLELKQAQEQLEELKKLQQSEVRGRLVPGTEGTGSVPPAAGAEEREGSEELRMKSEKLIASSRLAERMGGLATVWDGYTSAEDGRIAGDELLPALAPKQVTIDFPVSVPSVKLPEGLILWVDSSLAAAIPAEEWGVTVRAVEPSEIKRVLREEMPRGGILLLDSERLRDHPELDGSMRALLKKNGRQGLWINAEEIGRMDASELAMTLEILQRSGLPLPSVGMEMELDGQQHRFLYA